MNESDSGNSLFWSYPQPKGKAQPSEELHSIDGLLAEFDLKDITTRGDAKFEFKTSLESKLAYNALNGFKQTSQEQQVAAQKELLSKLETSYSATGSAQRTYTVTNEGVFLRKGEEMGMFQMGSTIVMLFECPKDTQISRKPGDKVKLGENLFN